MADLMVVRARIKEHSQGLNVAGDFADALSKRVVEEIQKAANRAKANGRATLKPRDL